MSEFSACPFCKQYSHSIGDDQLTAAFMHFQSMYAHPVRGHPMGHNFDEQTRDAAQVLMAAARAASVDTHPKGGDAQQAPSLMGSAVPERQTPQPVQSPPLSQGDE